MTYLYIVRCEFVRADLEASWNDWYSGPKVRQMLAKPMFRAVQRFRLSAGSGRRYLALWQVDAPDALTTAAYRSDWGFSEWQQHIVDWSRDLFDATGARDGALAVPMHGVLHVIAFDGMDADRAAAARATLAADAATMWFPSAGLDRHTPTIGLRPFPDSSMAQSSLAQSLPAGVQAGVYRPITAYCTAAALAHGASGR